MSLSWCYLQDWLAGLPDVAEHGMWHVILDQNEVNGQELLRLTDDDLRGFSYGKARKAPELQWGAMRASILAHRDRLAASWQEVRLVHGPQWHALLQCHGHVDDNDNDTAMSTAP